MNVAHTHMTSQWECPTPCLDAVEGALCVNLRYDIGYWELALQSYRVAHKKQYFEEKNTFLA